MTLFRVEYRLEGPFSDRFFLDDDPSCSAGERDRKARSRSFIIPSWGAGVRMSSKRQKKKKVGVSVWYLLYSNFENT